MKDVEIFVLTKKCSWLTALFYKEGSSTAWVVKNKYRFGFVGRMYYWKLVTV